MSTLHEIKVKAARDALIRNKFNKSKAAQELDITRATLYALIKDSDVNDSRANETLAEAFRLPSYL